MIELIKEEEKENIKAERIGKIRKIIELRKGGIKEKILRQKE